MVSHCGQNPAFIRSFPTKCVARMERSEMPIRAMPSCYVVYEASEPGEQNATIDWIGPPCSADAWAGKRVGAGQSGVGVLRSKRRQERDSQRPAWPIRRLPVAGRPRGGGMEVLSDHEGEGR